MGRRKSLAIRCHYVIGPPEGDTLHSVCFSDFYSTLAFTISLPLDSLLLRGVSAGPAFRPLRGHAWCHACLRRRARKQKQGPALTPRNNRLSSGRAMAFTFLKYLPNQAETWCSQEIHIFDQSFKNLAYCEFLESNTMTGSSCSTQAICYMGIALGSALGIKLFCLSR